MKAVILCAGYGTRLYPLTITHPKPLLNVSRKPVLNYIIKKLEEISEIDKIFIITNDKFFNNFEIWKTQNLFSKPIELLNDKTKTNEERLGAIGDLWLVIKEKNIQDNIIVINGDNIFNSNLKEIINYFNKIQKTTISIYKLQNKDEGKRFGIVEMKNNKITNFEEKPENPKTNLRSAGIYLFTKLDIEKIKEFVNSKTQIDGSGTLIKYLSEIQDVHGFKLQGINFDIGTPENYQKAQEIWSKNDTGN